MTIVTEVFGKRTDIKNVKKATGDRDWAANPMDTVLLIKLAVAGLSDNDLAKLFDVSPSAINAQLYGRARQLSKRLGGFATL